MRDIAEVDLVDPRTHVERDLRPVFARLRRVRPVAWHPARADVPGFWVVSSHADSVAVCRDTQRFGSTGGNVLATLLRGGDSAAGRMLAVSDGSRHTELRMILRNAFTPAALRPFRTKIRDAARRLVSAAARAGECDFASAVAAQIPLVAICDLLGVPPADRGFILAHTRSALSSDVPRHSAYEARLAQGEILLYFARLAKKRLLAGADDLVTLLVAGTVDGRRLTEDEIVLNCYSIILGGDETTRLAMVGAVLALGEHPDQWRMMRDGRVSLVPATEEVLRWTTPAMHLGRTATEDVPLGGEVVRAGDVVTAWMTSANFDAAAFERPQVFDLARRPNRHLTFAHGPHFCLGALLARIEISALLESLRAEVADIEITAPGQPIYSNFLQGFSTLPVLLHAGRQRIGHGNPGAFPHEPEESAHLW